MFVRVCASVLLYLLCFPVPAAAQAETPATPPSPWKLNIGGGLAFTSGNKDTSTYNASYEAAYRPHNRHMFKSDAMLIRGTTEGVLSNERFGFNLREEFRVNERIFVFGQNQYLRDRFKRIQYRVAPTSGVGLTTVSSDTTTVTIDVGAGGVWEKNPYSDIRASGALTFSQELRQTISSTTTLSQSLSGLWKTEDLSDSFYELGIALALAINSRVQLKIEALDTYSNRPTGNRVKKNDVSTVFAIVVRN